jgi:hypothetical protein
VGRRDWLTINIIVLHKLLRSILKWVQILRRDLDEYRKHILRAIWKWETRNQSERWVSGHLARYLTTDVASLFQVIKSKKRNGRRFQWTSLGWAQSPKCKVTMRIMSPSSQIQDCRHLFLPMLTMSDEPRYSQMWGHIFIARDRNVTTSFLRTPAYNLGAVDCWLAGSITWCGIH